MSLLDNGPDTLIITPSITVLGPDGQPRQQPGSARIELVGATVQGSSTSDNSASVDGQQGRWIVRVLARELPEGVTLETMEYSVVEWAGHRWKLDGIHRQYRRSPRTRHVSWTMMEVGRSGEDEQQQVG